MATSLDYEEVNIIEEVEDVKEELIKIIQKPLQDEIDPNDIYDFLERMINKEPTSKAQRLAATVETMKGKIESIKKSEQKMLWEASTFSCDQSFDDPEEMDDVALMAEGENKHLNALILLYPDVDRLTLKNKTEEFGTDWHGLETWLNENIENLPERKQVLALSRLQLTDEKKKHGDISEYESVDLYLKRIPNTLRQCPSCDSWKMVDWVRETTKGEVAECKEIGCGISYCLTCNRKDHRPFTCRKDDEAFRSRTSKDTNNIFKPLLELPTANKDGIKRYLMFPKNDMDFTNPLDILYMTAEATFLRMVERSHQHNGNVTRRSIKSIEYIENQSNTESFLAKQNNFLAKKINTKERLCFHGTTDHNVESILKENFKDGMIRRCAYGRGHYFSEFPDVSAGYGQGLLLCRILLGNSWNDSTGSNITEQYNSKIVRADGEGKGWAIVIPDSTQILPAFVIKLKTENK